MILDIVRYPDARLRQKGVTVEAVTPELRAFIRDMMDTMFARDGVGLAAIQVGRPERIFVLEASVCGRPKTDDPVVFINPEIVAASGPSIAENEGCLSFPGIFFPVKRFSGVAVKATDLEGQEFSAVATGLYARAIQHEHDHTVGKTLMDHANIIWRDRIRKRMGR